MIQKKKFPASRILKRTKSNVKLEGPSSIHGKDFSNTKRLFKKPLHTKKAMTKSRKPLELYVVDG